MKMYLKNIESHTHQGRREYQEDSYAHGDDFILVSDGVGGLAKGNIASDIVARTWKTAFEQKRVHLASLEDDVKAIVSDTLSVLLSYAAENPESTGMGATLACTAMIEDKLVSIHIGDSRVYHFSKDGELRWRSKDHSLVQELIDAAIITEDEAATHPRRNVITRVLQAKEGHEVKAGIHILDDVDTDDIVLVCSDGVNESWSDSGITSVLMGKADMKDTIRAIGAYSAEHSSDNNTAVIAQVVMVQKTGETTVADPLSTAAATSGTADAGVMPETPEKNVGADADQNPEDEKSSTNNTNEDTKLDHNSQKGKHLLRYKRNLLRWAGLGIAVVFLYFMLDNACSKPKSNTNDRPAETGSHEPNSSDERTPPRTENPSDKNTGKGTVHPIVKDNNADNKKDADKTLSSTQDLVIIEDTQKGPKKISEEEETLYKTFEKSKKLQDAEAYLKKYPKGAYSETVEKSIRKHRERDAGKKTPVLDSTQKQKIQ